MNIQKMAITPIYHITHIRNLESIIEKGGLLCDNEMSRLGVDCQGIAYHTLKDRRAATAVLVSVQGTLADYIPFYFTNRSPMLGAIHKGLVEGYHGGQREVLHLVSSVERVIREDLRWCFTDGHAVEATTEFHEDIRNMTRIDWSLIESWQWGKNLDDPDRMRRKQAEFLVYRFFPWPLIEYIGVYDEEIKNRVISIVSKFSHKPLINIEPKWYYKSKGKT